MKKISKKKTAVNIGASLDIGYQKINNISEIEVLPGTPVPENYTYCAGTSCVTCVSRWDSNTKKWIQTCIHFTYTGGKGHAL